MPLGMKQKTLNLLRSVRRSMRVLSGTDIPSRIEARVAAEFLGSDYGGWWVARDFVSQDDVVFSVGIGMDNSFDLAMIERFGVKVFAFDPTPKSKQWLAGQQLPPAFHFVPVGLSDADGEMVFKLDNPDWDSYTAAADIKGEADIARCPVARFSTLCQQVNVDRVDILKIDIEGSEYAAVPDLLNSGIPVGQLLVELHYVNGNTPELQRAAALLETIRAAGFRLLKRSAFGREFSFIHLSRLSAPHAKK